MKSVFQCPAVLDLSAAANVTYTWTPQKDTIIYPAMAFAILEEAVAAGGFSSVAPAVRISRGNGGSAVTIASYTLTASDLSGGLAVGAEKTFTGNDTYVTPESGALKIAAGTQLNFEVLTQGTGGTTTGTMRVFLPYDRSQD